MKPPCYGCKERVADPNCHNVDRCERWAEYVAIRDRRYEDELKRKNASRITPEYNKSIRTKMIQKGRGYVKTHE